MSADPACIIGPCDISDCERPARWAYIGESIEAYACDEHRTPDMSGPCTPPPRGPLIISPFSIKVQRSTGWPDIHPEDYCHLCGTRNVKAWHAPLDLWAAVRDQFPPSGIVCPQCFTEAVERTGLVVVWSVAPDSLTVPESSGAEVAS